MRRGKNNGGELQLTLIGLSAKLLNCISPPRSSSFPLQQCRQSHILLGSSSSHIMAAEQRKLLGKPALIDMKHLTKCPISDSRIFTNHVSTEQLMGAGASSRHAQLSITDPKICRSYIVGTCPHDLFTNTKQDLGPCPKVHSEPLKSEYEAAPDKSKYGFEYDYMRDMQKYIDECNRRIDAAQRRLEKTPDEIRQTNDLVGFLRGVAD